MEQTYRDPTPRTRKFSYPALPCVRVSFDLEQEERISLL